MPPISETTESSTRQESPFRTDGKLRTVYGLADPETGDLKYIGCTRDLDSRIKQHLSQRSGNDHAHYEWMRGLAERGLSPFVIRFGVFPQAIAFGVEQTLIEKLAPGMDISNSRHAKRWLGANGEPTDREAVAQLARAVLQMVDPVE